MPCVNQSQMLDKRPRFFTRIGVKTAMGLRNYCIAPPFGFRATIYRHSPVRIAYRCILAQQRGNPQHADRNHPAGIDSTAEAEPIVANVAMSSIDSTC